MATAIVPVQEEKALTKITNYMESAVVQARFAKIMGEKGASNYIASVLIAVADSNALQKCSPMSIYTGALRAATLRLSVDPGVGQAYLVPFKDRATLIVGYKGLHDMAVRTNRYRYINVSSIYEGQEVIEDQITGFHRLAGARSGNKVIGWIGAFEMLPRFGGYSKTIYMTVEEIHEHAKKYSKGYGTPNKDGVLVDNYGKPTIWHTEKDKMERKTILRLLLRKWGYIDPADVKELNELENEEPVEAEFNELAETAEIRMPEVKNSKEANIAILSGDGNPDLIKDETWKRLEELRAKAANLNIIIPDVDRTATTDGDLREYLSKIAPQIEA
jgi:recombination protein RecT